MAKGKIQRLFHLKDGGYVPVQGEYEGHFFQDGAFVEDAAIPGDSVPAMIGEGEVVVPLDNPEAVEVMAEAIAEGNGEASQPGTEEVAEAAEAVAEAAEAVAEAAEEIAEENAEVAEMAIAATAAVAVEAVESSAEVSEEATEEVAEVAEEVAEEVPEAAEEIVEEAVRDRAPREGHWSQRKMGKRAAS